ncbi:MAG: hypothetical protein VKP72_03590 [bacterium]|nr:hypothetical protein [bacterium]
MRRVSFTIAAIALVACQPPSSPGTSGTGTTVSFPMESRDLIYRDLQTNSPDDFPHLLGLRDRQIRVTKREEGQAVECRVTDTDQYPFPGARVRTVLWVREGERIVVKTASGDATIDGWPASWTSPAGLATPPPPALLEIRPQQVSTLATTSSVVRSVQLSGLSYAERLKKVFRDSLLVRQILTTDFADFRPFQARSLNLTERTLAPDVGILFESTLTETLVGGASTYTRLFSELASVSAAVSP